MDHQEITEPLLFAQLKSYKDVKLKLEKFKAIRKAAPAVTTSMLYVIAASSFILGFLFGSVTLAFFLGSLFGSILIGFGCVAVIFIILGIVLLILHKVIQKPIVNLIIKKTCN